MTPAMFSNSGQSKLLDFRFDHLGEISMVTIERWPPWRGFYCIPKLPAVPLFAGPSQTDGAAVSDPST